MQYIGGYVILQLYKKLRIAKAKNKTNQFILSKTGFRSTYECENQNKNSKLSRGDLLFILELLQKNILIELLPATVL